MSHEDKKNQNFLAWEFTHLYKGDISLFLSEILNTQFSPIEQARWKIKKVPVLIYTLFYIWILYFFYLRFWVSVELNHLSEQSA